MRLLQINSVVSYGSTGKIVEQISMKAQAEGWESVVAHGVKYSRPTSQKELLIGDKWDVLRHEIQSFVFDQHGLGSVQSTKKLIEQIKRYAPDVIHLHNIHNYYLNYPILFEYLESVTTQVVWTLHDCWPFTGHCSYFDGVGCDRWRTGCGKCPGLIVYPRSLFFDRSEKNYEEKERWFSAIVGRLTIVPVSHWLEGLVRLSFLKNAPIITIHNGIDVGVFSQRDTMGLREKLGIGRKKVVLGVAMPWAPRKGLFDMYQLAGLLPPDLFQVIVVGLSEKQIRQCPNNVIGLRRTSNVRELVEIYSLATVFVNPTYEDNYPTTNLEAMACGTPVITYCTGGSPEAVTSDTGWIVEQGNTKDMAKIIEDMSNRKDEDLLEQRLACRQRAEKEFDKDKCFEQYIQLYKQLMENA